MPKPPTTKSPLAKQSTKPSAPNSKKHSTRNVPIVFESTLARNAFDFLITESDIKEIVSETRLSLIQHVSPIRLAWELSRVGDRFLRTFGTSVPSPPGTRAKWAQTTAAACKKILVQFDCSSPATAAALPSAQDALVVLQGWDQGRSVGPGEVSKLVFGPSAKEAELVALIQGHPPASITASETSNLDEKDDSGISEAIMQSHVQTLRLALFGVQYLGLLSGKAAKAYSKMAKNPKQYSAEGQFFIDLCRMYQYAFDRRPALSTNEALSQRTGPTIRFCQVVSRILMARTAIHIADEQRRKRVLESLDKWSRSPNIVGEKVRYALKFSDGKENIASGKRQRETSETEN